MNDYIAKLESEKEDVEDRKNENSHLLKESHYEQRIKELNKQRSILEAQIKFGVDSLKLEQEKVRLLEEELSKYSSEVKRSHV